MAMGQSKRERQSELWIAGTALPCTPGHPFYRRLNAILHNQNFDSFVEQECAPYYTDKVGRPSMPPTVYFKLLFVGYFEGIDSERGIAWRVADSMALRDFLGYAITDSTPDHSTISRTRRLLSLETHQAVFTWVLGALTDAKLLTGNTLGIDATTLEANAALRSIVRRDNGETYDEFLDGLATASGIETPTRDDRSKIDKNRKGKGSNKDWKSPSDPDARITKMKDGRTHLAHKCEHAIDMDSGAIVSVTVQGADLGDTTTMHPTLEQAQSTISEVAQTRNRRSKLKPLREVVADKGYHSNAVLSTLHEDHGLTTCISEPNRGRRKWKGKKDEQKAVYKNRGRIKSEPGIALRKRRSEIVERSFAHCYETGGMRRTHLRKHENILKRLLIHTGAFNLSLILRKTTGAGTPRGLRESLKNQCAALVASTHRRIRSRIGQLDNLRTHYTAKFLNQPHTQSNLTSQAFSKCAAGNRAFTTGC